MADQLLDLSGLKRVLRALNNIFVKKDGNKVLSDNNFSDAEKLKLQELGSFTLEPATTSVLGGVIIGNGLAIDGSGVVNVIGQASQADLTKHEKMNMLALDEVPNTSSSVEYDSSGNVTRILHRSGANVLRTDEFVYGATSISEIRTLSTNETLTIATNTETLVTTTTYGGF